MNLVLSGYFGFGNSGDEIILERTLKQLQTQGHTITVLSQTPRQTAAQYAVRSVSRWNPVAWFRNVRQCGVLISGGGGLMQDLSGALTPVYYLSHLALAHWLGKRTMIWGQGFGPLTRKWNRRLAKKILSNVELIVVRDLAGLVWCQSLGIPERQLLLGADLAWLLPSTEARSGDDWALCLRADWLPGKIPDWVTQVAEAARTRNRRLRIVTMGNRGDWQWIRRLKTTTLFKFCDWVDADPVNLAGSAPSWFQGTELVISQRYHGLILGALAGAAVTGFGPDAKLTHLLSELGQPVFDPKAGERGLNGLVESLPELRQRVQHHRETLIRRAQAGSASILERLTAGKESPLAS